MKKQTIVISLESRIPCFCIQEHHIKWLKRKLPNSEIIWCRDREGFLTALTDADTVLTWRFKQKWFELSPRLRRIGTPAAGRDFFKVTSLPDHIEMKNGTFHGPIMAETAVGMMLAVNRGILKAYRHQLDGEIWPDQPLFGSRLLCGTHAVIIGFGRIGQHVGRLLKAFGVRITGLRRNVSSDIPDWFEKNDKIMTGRRSP